MAAFKATEKLYLQDPYLVSFDATLRTCDEQSGRKFVAVLDRTYFYPESGGQLSDRGEIGGAAVSDVREDDSGVVYHEIDKKLSPGPVRCRVDWERRFEHMQHHTGQHILSRAFIEVGGLETVSFHMGEAACTIDLEGGELGEGVLKKAEDRANEVIWENRPVVVRTVARAELADTALRKSLPEGVAEVRLVEIESFDVIGCCGTHVKRTGELGLAKILKFEKAKKGYRVYFKVGARAFRDFQAKHEIIKNLAARFTTSIEEVESKVLKLEAEKAVQRKSYQKLAKSLAALEKEKLVGTAEILGGSRFVVYVCEEYDEEYLKLLASEFKQETRTVSLLATADGLVLCNASPDTGVDFSRPVVERAKAIGGSGGGKGGFATVRLPKSADVRAFLRDAFESLKAGSGGGG